jgi:hypothetical protein
VTSGKAAVSDPGKRPGFLLLFAAIVVGTSAADAQSIVVPPESPVRFQLDTAGVFHQAILEGIRPDSIFLSRCADCARQSFALKDIVRLDVKTPPPGSVARKVALSAVVGLGAGLVLGAVAGTIYDDKTCHQGEIQLCGLGTIVFGLAGIPVGAITGGILGRWSMRAKWTNAIPGDGWVGPPPVRQGSDSLRTVAR